MQLGDLKSKMELEWPSLACPSCDNAWFWQYEWVKHGTCVLKNQYDYFAATLRLKESVDLLGALGNNSIYPDGKKYNLSEIQRVLGNVTGNGVGIECNGMEQLCQVYICVDKNASNFIRCPVRETCIGTVVEFPSMELARDRWCKNCEGNGRTSTCPQQKPSDNQQIHNRKIGWVRDQNI